MRKYFGKPVVKILMLKGEKGETGDSDYEPAVDALGKRIDNLILSSGTESSAEVADARTGYDGTSYPTLGTAIRKQVSELLANSKKAIAELADKKITKFYANSLGETTLNDSDKGKIQNMMLYGKSEQFSGKIELEDGATVTVPCPDYPQEIKSVVNPVVTVCGKNLIDKSIFTFLNGRIFSQTFLDILPNTKYTFSVSESDGPDGRICVYDDDKNLLETIIQSGSTPSLSTITTPSNAKYLRIDRWYIGGISSIDDIDIQLEIGSVATEYEPYKEHTASLPYTLNAIPVSEGGNVTIDGQQYIADYVDIENKKLHRYVNSSKFDETVSIIDNMDLLLSTPTITDLTDEEVQAFKDLMTYYSTTNVIFTSDQLDGYTVFNYPISMKNGWNYVKEQIGDTRDYIYDMELQSAEAYVNSEYAVALTELGV